MCATLGTLAYYGGFNPFIRPLRGYYRCRTVNCPHYAFGNAYTPMCEIDDGVTPAPLNIKRFKSDFDRLPEPVLMKLIGGYTDNHAGFE